MVNRFNDVYDILDTLKVVGYNELSFKHISPFDTSQIIDKPYKEEELYKTRWFLEKITEKEPSIFVSVGESVYGAVHVDFFVTAGIKIHRKMNGGLTESLYWLGSRIEYLPTEQGLAFMAIQRMEKKWKTNEKIVKEFIRRGVKEMSMYDRIIEQK